MSSIPDVLVPFPVGDDTPDMMSGCIPPLPDISHLISAHGKRHGNHCQIGDGSVMSPMDEAMWFAFPVGTFLTITSGQEVLHILDANPQRVGLRITVGGWSALTVAADLSMFQLTPEPLNSSAGVFGWNATKYQSGIEILQKDWGCIPMCGWSAAAFTPQGEGALSVWITEIILNDWPACKEESKGA